MEPKSKFHVTFGQKHPLRNGWIEVQATSAEEAKVAVEYALGKDGYSNIHDTTLFDIGLFPAGKYGEILYGN